MYCKQCYRMIPDDSTICPSCGKSQSGNSNNTAKKKNNATSTTTYDMLKPYIAPKDGKVHVLMITSRSHRSTKSFVCEDKYTTQLDSIISSMQDDGYEIVDVKPGSFKEYDNPLANLETHTLIMYK